MSIALEALPAGAVLASECDYHHSYVWQRQAVVGSAQVLTEPVRSETQSSVHLWTKWFLYQFGSCQTWIGSFFILMIVGGLYRSLLATVSQHIPLFLCFSHQKNNGIFWLKNYNVFMFTILCLIQLMINSQHALYLKEYCSKMHFLSLTSHQVIFCIQHQLILDLSFIDVHRKWLFKYKIFSLCYEIILCSWTCNSPSSQPDYTLFSCFPNR